VTFFTGLILTVMCRRYSARTSSRLRLHSWAKSRDACFPNCIPHSGQVNWDNAVAVRYRLIAMAKASAMRSRTTIPAIV